MKEGAYGGEGMLQGLHPMPYMVCYPYSHGGSAGYGHTGHSYPPIGHHPMPYYYPVAHEGALSYFQANMQTNTTPNLPLEALNPIYHQPRHHSG